METSTARQDADLDALGPVDYLVVEFPADRADFSGAMATELTALMERGLIRVLDLLLIRKEADGSFDVDEIKDADESDLGAMRALEAELAMLIAEEDIAAIADTLEPGTIAAVLVYENSWAAPFAAAVRHSGGLLVADGRIPVQALIA